MSETQFLNSATETDSNFKSPHLSTSCSHLPVKFTIYEPDPEDSDDSHRLAQVSISNNMVDTKAIGDPFDDNEGKRSVMSSVLGPYVLKNTLSNSFASIPNHIRSGEYKNKQYNTSKQSCQNNAINSLLTSKTSLSSSSIIGSHKLHQSSQNIPLIGLRSNSNLTISSLSTVQSRHIVESSSTSALSNQNVSKPSRSRPRRFANLYSTMSIDEILQQIRDMYGDYSLAMVEDEEDTDGDAELVPTTFPHMPRTLSDSSLSSQLTGRSKSASLEDVCHSDQPVNLDRSSKCSVLGTTDDELKVVSDADIPFKHVPSFSDPSHFSTIGDEPQSQQLNTIKRCPTPEVKCHLTSGTTPNEVMSDSFQVPHKSVKEKKKRTRKKRLGSHHHDEVSSSKLMQLNYLNTQDPSLPDTSVVSSMEPPITCGPGHDHPGRVYTNTDIPLNVNALFQCIFTDSEFFSRFSEHRGTFGMIQSPWPIFKWSSPSDCLNQLETSSKIERTITYTLTLKQKLGPRTCTAVEQQTLLSSESISGKRYIIDAKVTNHAVPLSNCFYVVSRYCLLYVNRTTSRLHVSSQVIYEKPVFFGAKSIIENTCHSGLSDFFDTITIKLKEFSTNLSLEERLTGGWLAQQRGCLNNITPSLNPSNIQNNPLLIQSVNGNQNNRKLNKVDTLFTGNVNSSKVPASRYSDQAKSSIFNNCINDNTNVKKQNKTTLFGSGDMTYLFMRPDRAWLLLVVIGLLLCLFLSMVYNRLVVLEKLAEQFPPLSAHDRNHFHDLFGTSPQEDRGSIPIYKDHLASKSPEWARTRLKVMKDLIHLLSKTLIQMQQTLTQVQQGIELLEFPPSNLEDNIKTSMNVKTPTNTDTNCPDTQTKHVP
ncbi:unnamed protein product [Schistosoma haematobium]|nr:unnamed protein product [Schistosoma haematobium]